MEDRLEVCPSRKKNMRSEGEEILLEKTKCEEMRLLAALYSSISSIYYVYLYIAYTTYIYI